MVLREARKVKHILSKSIYNDLFNNLNTANNILKALVETSVASRQSQRTERPIPVSLRHRKMRAIATSTHRSLVCGKYWGCLCQNKHYIQFFLDPRPDSELDPESRRLALATNIADDPTQSLFIWQEMEVESHATKPMPSSITKQESKVGFTVFSEQQMCHEQGHAIQPSPIVDLCSALSKAETIERKELAGYLTDESYDHHVYTFQRVRGSPQAQTLEEIILSSPLLPWIPTGDGIVFNRRDRLQLAAELAYSVLQFHGNWLRANWNSHDIMFHKGHTDPKKILRPFLVLSISERPEATVGPTLSSVIRNRTLFPLGLALIELSLCRTITALKIPEDENPDEEVTLLKTANRCLNHVYVESGSRYGDVVQQCLFWSHTPETNLDCEELQDLFFQHIMVPLQNDVKDFDGRVR